MTRSTGSISSLMRTPSVLRRQEAKRTGARSPRPLWRTSTRSPRRGRLSWPTQDLDKALSQCPAVAPVTVEGHEAMLSKKGRPRSFPDGPVGAIGQPDIFVYQILASGRTEPSVMDLDRRNTQGLGLRGLSITRRFPRPDHAQTREILEEEAAFLALEAAMVSSLLDPASYPHPQLASRWSTAPVLHLHSKPGSQLICSGRRTECRKFERYSIDSNLAYTHKACAVIERRKTLLL
jgi:hypothetical protein